MVKANEQFGKGASARYEMMDHLGNLQVWVGVIDTLLSGGLAKMRVKEYAENGRRTIPSPDKRKVCEVTSLKACESN